MADRSCEVFDLIVGQVSLRKIGKIILRRLYLAYNARIATEEKTEDVAKKQIYLNEDNEMLSNCE